MLIVTRTFLYIEILCMTVILANNLSTTLIILCHKNVRCTISDFLLSLFTGNVFYGISIGLSVLVSYVPSLLTLCRDCCIVHIVMEIVSALAILYSLIAMTIDRYIAVFYPLRYCQIVNPLSVKIVIIVIWSISLVTGCLPFAWNITLEINSRSSCSFTKIIPSTYIWSFIIPPAILTNVIILHVYLKICRLKYRRSRRVATIQSFGDDSNSRHDSKTNVIVGIIIFSSVFALTPFLIAVMLIITGVLTSKSSLLYTITYGLSFINPVFTPIIFAWRNENFNKTLKAMLCKKAGQKATERFRKEKSEVSEIIPVESTIITYS